MKSLTPSLIVLLGCMAFSDASVVHWGDCPKVKQIGDFQMSQFLGKWYSVQMMWPKIPVRKNCVTYNYSVTHTPSKYNIIESGHIPVIGYRFVGTLNTDSRGSRNSSHMTERFPIYGHASHKVIDTDYVNYAGIFTCREYKPFMFFTVHRWSATVLSRKPTLGEKYVNKVHKKFSSFGIDISEISNISHDDCKKNVYYFPIDYETVNNFMEWINHIFGLKTSGKGRNQFRRGRATDFHDKNENISNNEVESESDNKNKISSHNEEDDNKVDKESEDERKISSHNEKDANVLGPFKKSLFREIAQYKD
ncbi:apolipoprotein D-like [Copidosoma floridanum]|uniref:apolipoprotein D-like n=1 Tax=Copidosoma floridanum TaxID=29053 RepID=UPI000C6F7692|nr:apolipoprotein D-like [Copidosoma floridanum]